MAIKTFVFLDLETTGLPSLDGNTTKITELCLIAIEADHLKQPTFRVKNKLNFCFNPGKSLERRVTELTGLSDPLLQTQFTFKEKVNVISQYLETLTKPICFVAHNGIRFDYPILQAELFNSDIRLPADVLCVDSIEAFKAIEQNGNKITRSYKLSEVYRRLTGKSPVNAHEAEADTIMMMECAGILGEQFVNWANNNAKAFADIVMIIPI